MKANVSIEVDIKLEAWVPRPAHLTLDELVVKVREAGNMILSVDREHERILIGKVD